MVTTANLDHILFVQNKKIDILQCNILDDTINMSDHRAINCTFNINFENMFDNITIKKVNNVFLLDFTNQNIIDFYRSRIDFHSNNFFNEFFIIRIKKVI